MPVATSGMIIQLLAGAIRWCSTNIRGGSHAIEEGLKGEYSLSCVAVGTDGGQAGLFLQLFSPSAPSSPTRPAAYRSHGYAYAYPRGLSHHASYEQTLPSREPKSVLQNVISPAYAIIPPRSALSVRSSFSSTSPSDASHLRASFPTASAKSAVHGMCAPHFCP